MINDDRIEILMDYVAYIMDNNIKKITNEMKPKNKEEEEWVNAHIEFYKQEQKETEELNKNYEKAKKEAEELLDKYLSKDYKPMGKFNNPIFKLKEKKIEELVQEEIKKHPEVQKDLIIDDFYIRTKIKLFKKIYKINWKPYYFTLPDEFDKKYQAILDKYDLFVDVLDF